MKLNAFEGARRISLAFGGLWVIGCLAFAVFSEPYASLTYSIAWPEHPAVKAKDCSKDDATEHVNRKTSKGRSVSILLCFTAQEATDGRRLVPFAVISGATPFTAPWENDPIVQTGKQTVQKPEYPSTLRELYEALKEADAKGQVERAKKLVALIDALPAELRPSPRYSMNQRYSNDVVKYGEDVAARFSLSPDGMKDAEEAVWASLLEQWKEAMQALAGGLFVGWVLTVAIGWVVRGFMGVPRGKDVRPAV